MTDVSGLPPSRVFGTGTMLDTARLKYAIGQSLDVDPHSIHAQVVGEHGDSEVVLWSSARAGGVPLRKWVGWSQDREADIAERVRQAAHEIIQRKGATNHAIGLVTADLLRCVFRNERRVLTLSRMQHGALGLDNVVLSLPTIVGVDGAIEVLEPEMNPDERERLHRSAAVMRRAAQDAGCA
jgi:L-lactate dehydrogenase